MGQFYFTPKLTGDEHWIVEDLIRNYCNEREITVHYYRQFKNGHEPTWRECKVSGPLSNINRFKVFLEENYVEIRNYNARH